MVPFETTSPDFPGTSSLTHDSCLIVMLPFKSEISDYMDILF